MIIDPAMWFTKRELDHVPKHFIKCPSTLSPKSIEWVKNKASGRYAFADPIIKETELVLAFTQNVYFEKQEDAVMFELLWSGS